MTKAEYDKRLAELEAEADRCGCCVVPVRPLREPKAAKKKAARKSAEKRRVK
jgi:hypothetical protein